RAKLTPAASSHTEVGRTLGIDIPNPVTTFAPPAVEEDVECSVRQWARLVAAKAKIPAGCAEAIAEWHGRHALAIAHAASHDERLREPLCLHSCHLVAEAVEAGGHESAGTLGGILLRRVPGALGACWSEECSREAAHKIGNALGWDQSRIYMELLRLEEEREQFLHPRHGPAAGPGCGGHPSPLHTETA